MRDLITPLQLILLVSLITGCSYKFGYEERDLPEGHTEVAIPVFKNKTREVAIEGMFTNELIQRFNRSRVAKVVTSEAPVVIEGTITKVEYVHGGQLDGSSPDNKIGLPANAVLTTEYRVLVDALLVLRRRSDQKVIWQGAFNNESVYTAPQVGLPVVNSVNPLYNHSARIEVIERMARDMMSEAHDRITENF